MRTTAVLPLFDLRHPRDVKPTTSRRGTLSYICLKRTFLAHCPVFSCVRGPFLALLGTQGIRVYSRGKLGPRPCSVARALGVQSRSNCSASPSLAGILKPHNFLRKYSRQNVTGAQRMLLEFFLPSKLDFPPHSPPLNLTFFPDYVSNPDEIPSTRYIQFFLQLFRYWSDLQ